MSNFLSLREKTILISVCAILILQRTVQCLMIVVLYISNVFNMHVNVIIESYGSRCSHWTLMTLNKMLKVIEWLEHRWESKERRIQAYIIPDIVIAMFTINSIISNFFWDAVGLGLNPRLESFYMAFFSPMPSWVFSGYSSFLLPQSKNTTVSLIVIWMDK